MESLGMLLTYVAGFVACLAIYRWILVPVGRFLSGNPGAINRGLDAADRLTQRRRPR